MKFNNINEIRDHVYKYKGSSSPELLKRDVEIIADVHLWDMTYQEVADRIGKSRALVGQIMQKYEATAPHGTRPGKTAIDLEDIKMIVDRATEEYEKVAVEADILKDVYIKNMTFTETADKWGVTIIELRAISTKWKLRIKSLTR